MSIEKDIKQIRKDLNKLIEEKSCKCEPVQSESVKIEPTEQTATDIQGMCADLPIDAV